MSAEGIAADAAGRRLKASKAHQKRMAAINAERRAIEATGAKAIARCPEHGLHGERNECFVCYAPVELVAMVPAGEVERLRAERDRYSEALHDIEDENDRLRAALSDLIGNSPCRCDHPLVTPPCSKHRATRALDDPSSKGDVPA